MNKEESISELSVKMEYDNIIGVFNQILTNRKEMIKSSVIKKYKDFQTGEDIIPVINITKEGLILNDTTNRIYLEKLQIRDDIFYKKEDIWYHSSNGSSVKLEEGQYKIVDGNVIKQ